MKITKVKAVYYSATGNAKKVVEAIAGTMAKELDVPMESYDFTLPKNRTEVQVYGPEDLVVFGTPVYAGRVPNKMLPVVQGNFKGEGALAVPVVVFGNSNFDNGLIELRNELENNGFHTVAGAGIATSHVFSDVIAPGRPDEKDMALIEEFAKKAARKVSEMTEIPAPIAVRSINPENCAEVTGICIKCQACIKKCPKKAKYFDDPAFLSHVAMLEQNYTRRAEPEMFL